MKNRTLNTRFESRELTTNLSLSVKVEKPIKLGSRHRGGVWDMAATKTHAWATETSNFLPASFNSDHEEKIPFSFGLEIPTRCYFDGQIKFDFDFSSDWEEEIATEAKRAKTWVTSYLCLRKKMVEGNRAVGESVTHELFMGRIESDESQFENTESTVPSNNFLWESSRRRWSRVIYSQPRVMSNLLWRRRS